jgi:hypothetical protein
MITADSITFDEDEGRIVMIVTTDDGAVLRFDIHAVALDFYAEVRREIGPWAHEAEMARATMPPSYDSADAYALDDPKHPTYYERMVGDA